MKGRCLCGGVRFTAEGVDTNAHSCHCSMCRTWSGGPAISVAVASVAFEGEENVERYQSSAWAERGFCKRCGTNLFYRMKEQNQYIMWAGPFEDQTQFRLAGEIYIEEKPAMYNFAGDHPRMTGAEFLASIGVAAPSA
ncbi:MAG: GFA family protein [Gammaproteobacteria bacterium]